MNLHCDLDLEASKLIFFHDNPVHNDAPPFKVWSHTIERFRRVVRTKPGHAGTRARGHTDT